MGHMRVQNGAGPRIAAVDRCMQRERRTLHRTPALDHRPFQVAEEQAGCRHFGPEEPLRIHQKMFLGVRRQHAEMIAHALLISEPRRPAQHCGQFHPRLLQFIHATCCPFSCGAVPVTRVAMSA